MIETPEAIFNARKIARASRRLADLVMGTNDLVKELQAQHIPGRAPLLTALSWSVLAARRSGIAILDGVWNDVRDLEDLTPQLVEEIQHFFEVYKALEPGKTSSTGGLAGREAAWREIESARANFKRQGH